MQLEKIAWIMLFWFFVSQCLYFYEYIALKYNNCTPLHADFQTLYIANLLGVLIAGLVGGVILVNAIEPWLRNKPYGIALTLIFFVYSMISILITSIIGAYMMSQQSSGPFLFSNLVVFVIKYCTTIEFIKNYIVWLIVLLITIIILLVNDKYGPGVFRDFLLGKYFQPQREERIFMFLDLRSSTTIAEKLEEEKYFNFIKELFKDVTPSILLAKGEIYQYVGDEIVISWKMKNGTKNANCINCFFEIQQALNQKAEAYKEKYDVIPEFKAGLHYGYVMAGEVGVVKRDIVYSGDVLNTAARIQSKCNESGVDILLSKFLLDKLALPPHLFEPKRIGDMLLRGKQRKVVLYTV